jgi:anti-anti-sigma regulatory factor
MPFAIETSDKGLCLKLTGAVTIRDAQQLGKELAESLPSGAAVVVAASALEDVDTSILQLLVSLRKTASAFDLQEPSAAFLTAVDRSALRRELLPTGMHQ